MNLSQEAAEKIQALSFKPDAEVLSCLLPLASIYWADELPDPDRLFSTFAEGADRNYVAQLFAIRINYWNDGKLSDEEQSFWGEAQTQFPNWPIFQRLRLKEEDRNRHESIQNEALNFFIGLAEGADEFSVAQNENNTTFFSAQFDLTKGKAKWWQFWK